MSSLKMGQSYRMEINTGSNTSRLQATQLPPDTKYTGAVVSRRELTGTHRTIVEFPAFDEWMDTHHSFLCQSSTSPETRRRESYGHVDAARCSMLVLAGLDQERALQGWIGILEAGREERLTCNSYSILLTMTICGCRWV
ncbi:hypothetical protein PAAG_01362 [Paracoccidioides lutzii Pb01]|uniref:Uncharacterized protein n=1 Tax=Paracoccidioides lutzii (strain ATCC MYA-826 / Pb01) TaxID=502779 RepID=C1GS67_PARBA|nr:hypothetical protein PAAG_01362 [Paracoccidioides lutzii Pb01]EEH38900.2 hypothetical protein PAAG_01362 [Paracoccidioides lutzii Pb01]